MRETAWTDMATILEHEDLDVRRARAGVWFEKWIAKLEVQERISQDTHDAAVKMGVLKSLVEHNVAAEIGEMLLRQPTIFPGYDGLTQESVDDSLGSTLFRYRIEVVRQRPL